jgi:RecB family exonuclease
LPNFSLNLAVDALLKKEFDIYRAQQKPHPLIANLGYIPHQSSELATWRENFQGIEYHHPASDFVITGAIDDLWQDLEGNLIVVDYKATSQNYAITRPDQLRDDQKRQLDIYVWLLRQNNFPVLPTAYILYANANQNFPTFNAQLKFELTLIPHQSDTSWIEPTLLAIKTLLDGDQKPQSNADCRHCQYHKEIDQSERIQTLF